MSGTDRPDRRRGARGRERILQVIPAALLPRTPSPSPERTRTALTSGPTVCSAARGESAPSRAALPSGAQLCNTSGTHLYGKNHNTLVMLSKVDLARGF